MYKNILILVLFFLMIYYCFIDRNHKTLFCHSCSQNEVAQSVIFEFYNRNTTTQLSQKVLEFTSNDIIFVDWENQSYRFSDSIISKIQKLEYNRLLLSHSFVVLRVNSDSVCRISLFNTTMTTKKEAAFPKVYLNEEPNSPSYLSYLRNNGLFIIDFKKKSYSEDKDCENVYLDLFDCRFYNLLKKENKIREYYQYLQDGC